MGRRTAVTNTTILQNLVEEQEIVSRSIAEASEEFLSHSKIKGLSPDTIQFYKKEMKLLWRVMVEIEVPMDDVRKLKTSHIEKWIERMLELGRATSSINARIRAGRTFFNFCVKKEYCEKNPFDGVEQLKKRHEVGATFTKKQLNKLLDAPDITQYVGLRDLAIMLTFAHTGMRLKELNNLKVKDISFEGTGEIILQQTKNGYGRRIPLTKRLKTVLKAYIVERGVLETNILFVSVDDNQLTPRTIQERLKHYGVETGVENEVPVSPHAFRRTFCRLKVEAGVNLFVLQRMTGHTDLEMLKRYVQIYGKDLEQAIEKGFE